MKAVINLDDHAVIKWRLTDKCNYNCSYCIRHKRLFDDFDPLTVVPQILKIADKLHENSGKFIKIDLIGGEVTLLPLVELCKMFKGTVVKRINITTNFHKPLSFWKELSKVCNDIEFTITASYHHECCNLDEFLDKAEKVKDLFTYFKCETVYTYGSTYIDKFIDECKKRNIQFMIDEDWNDARCVGYSQKSNKTNYRYKVINDNDDVEFYKTKNDFLKRKSGCRSVDTMGFYCTRDFNTVYIEQNILMSCNSNAKQCQPLTDENIENFITKSPHICYRNCERKSRCSLCGNLSVYRKDYFDTIK